MPPRTRLQRSKFAFLRLPPEIRNIIYDLCLVAPLQNACVCRFKEEDNSRLSRHVRVWGAMSRNFYFLCGGQIQYPPSVHLLATCRMIYEEASPIFYGSNDFWIRLDSDMSQITPQEEWTTAIGRSIKHVRNVTLSFGTPGTAIAFYGVLDDLRRASSLESLYLHAYGWHRPEYVVNKVYSLMIHIHRTREGTELKPALDVLEVESRLKAEVKEILSSKLANSRPLSRRLKEKTRTQ